MDIGYIKGVHGVMEPLLASDLKHSVKKDSLIFTGL